MTVTSPTATTPAVAPTTRVIPGLLALAIGGFTIGTTEFVTMGVLPQIAEGLRRTEPEAAHGITAYALGVVVGVPILAILGARLPRRGLLLALMGAYAAFNVVTALAPTYVTFVGARFLDGLPHGAYFGIASLAAAGLVTPARRGRAIASVMLGLSVANVVGVPATTWMGQHLGWRTTYLACAVLAGLAAALIFTFLPATPVTGGSSGRAEARMFFARPQVWLTIAAGSIGFGGVFAIYSYIATTVTNVSGLPEAVVPLFLLAFGLGLVVGTWAGGELAAWSVYRSLLFGAIGTAVAMLAFWLAAPHGWWALPVVFVFAAVASVPVTNLQLRLMDVAGDAVTLGAAMNHASLNVGNALGAWAGGVVIAAGYGYRAPALLATALAAVGVLIIALSGVLARKTSAAR
ncbi:MFS transporter [Cryptosporangium phraense]|uniref:MFS transporter n=1 Tax=Cryptosporangium phraense TaxID=2593070 RepID=A0A545AUP5_9ACTN|nr:MFS transporter [Cryptosporangium phraense]TQS45057.1 MFS transporter [Cryptosporangium phraense]